ncbi:hypothetical protein NONO_c57420 [Nocardia nova SH22a]|uniref:YbaB/EbfC DNA-binding family protein n=1 Tax=Nocardia nova SH22a TaxID=1415166 RepID=W5TMD6_9NOCA|nr:YbaB/EbfC family nucleoid-associated protein [Nocardia nova]AHH20520.1 hypothetical protein NONO_c57420 [Nocardia nova SH22a]
MFEQTGHAEELGLKVQRARQAVEQIRGVGTVDGVRVVVDSDGRLLSVSLREGESILAAYNAALADMKPRIDQALQELRADPSIEAVSTFTDANAPRTTANPAERELPYDEDDDYYERRNRQGWLE